MLHNAVTTCIDLTLNITSTFINETVKFTQIQLSQHSSNTVRFSVSEKKTVIHLTYADLNLSSAPAVKLFHKATS